MKNSTIFYKSLYYVIFMVICMLFGYLFFVSGIDNKVRIKTYYQSSSSVSYKVNYENNGQIEDIDINYLYNGSFREKISGNYKYNVLAYLYVYENNVDDILWFRKYDLSDMNTINFEETDNVLIKDGFKLDFYSISNEVNNFISKQEKDLSGYLNIQIKFIEDVNISDSVKSRQIDINIPVTDLNKNITVDNILDTDSYYSFNRHSIMNFVLVTLSMLCFSLAFALLALIIRQFKIISNRQNKYSVRLKKILNKYDFCIVKVNRLYVNKKYNMIYVSSFDELLDVYNNKNIMISFKEVKRGYESIFVIIDANDAWIYRFTSDNIE